MNTKEPKTCLPVRGGVELHEAIQTWILAVSRLYNLNGQLIDVIKAAKSTKKSPDNQSTGYVSNVSCRQLEGLFYQVTQELESLLNKNIENTKQLYVHAEILNDWSRRIEHVLGLRPN